jgi:hypothetical protein
MFTHYYRTSENETTNSSVSVTAPSGNFTSFSAFASRQQQQQGGQPGQQQQGPPGAAAVSNMEAGKGQRLGGGVPKTGGHVLGGSGTGSARPGGLAPPAARAGAGVPPARANSGASLLAGSASSSSSSSSSSGAGAGAGTQGGKGYKLGSK